MSPLIWKAQASSRGSSPLLSQFPQVFGLDGLEEPGSVLLAADHLLELGRPALGEDRARRVGDEVHRVAGLADDRSGGKRLVRDRAGSNGRHRGIRRPAGVRATDRSTSIWRAVVVRGDPVEEERGAVRVLGLGGDAVGQRGGHGGRRSAGLSGRHQEEPDVAGHVLCRSRRSASRR